MLRHLLEVAVSLLSGCDTGLDNSDNEGVVVGALHIFPKQLLPSFYLIQYFSIRTKQTTIRFLSEVIKKKKKKRLSGSGQQPGMVSDQL